MSISETIIFKVFLYLILCLSTIESQQNNEFAEKHVYEIMPQLSPSQNVDDRKITIIRRSPSYKKNYPIFEFDLQHVYIPIVITTWLIFSNIVKILYQMIPKIPKYLPESCMLIVVGFVIGIVLRFGMSSPFSPLTAGLFFLIILPPIIFDAGYFMPKRIFFNNLGTILLMAVIGTIFNIFAIAFSLWGCGLTGIYGSAEDTPSLISILLFTSVVAATDPVAVLAVFEEIHVNELLYIIVFGESLLNDAVTVVMYHVMEVYSDIGFENVEPQDIVNGFISFFIVSLGGVLIGVLWGLLAGYVTRFTKRAPIVETSFIFLMGYMSYINAEMFHMSGILASTFCGITMKGYVESNISENSKITIRNGIKMVANSAETVVFILLGVAAIQSRHVWNTAFVILSVLFCSIFRIIAVTFLTLISNRYRLYKLSTNDQIIMSLGGLRGAVAFGLVLLMDEYYVPQKHMFVTTTLVIVFFTVFVQGIAVKPILKWLNVKLQDKRELNICETINERFTDHMMSGFEDIVGVRGNYNLLKKLRCLNKRFIEPIVLKDIQKPHSFTNILLRDNLQQINEQDGSLVLKEMVSNIQENPKPEGYKHDGFTNSAFRADEVSEINLNSKTEPILRHKIRRRLNSI